MTTTTHEEWLLSRQKGVGSSDSPVLALGDVFGKTSLDLYIDKKAPIKPQEDNVNFRRGHTYEPLAVKIAEAKLGQRIFAPETDHERWNLYQVWHPDRPYMFADFDGLREDGWVVEVKSPMQRIADLIRVKGLKDYYQVQGQHLVELASVCPLPMLGGHWTVPRECPGVCFVIYECEKVDVQIYEIPRNEMMIQAIVANAERFWLNHVQTDTPPTEARVEPNIIVENTKADYEPVKGDAWNEAIAQFTMAKEGEAAAKKRLDAAKNRIIKAMSSAQLAKVITDGGWRFQHVEQAGRKSLDLKRLKAEHPSIDLDKYRVQGKSFMTFRNYGPKDQAKWGDETLDGQLLTLQDELQNFAQQSLDIEVAVEAFDELRSRADLYSRMLALELEGISAGLEVAAEAIAKKKEKEQ